MSSNPMKSDVWWEAAKNLAGKTLYTRGAKRASFRVLSVSENSLKITYGTNSAPPRPYSKELILGACEIRSMGREVNPANLIEAGVAHKKTGYTYLPVVIDAILGNTTSSESNNPSTTSSRDFKIAADSGIVDRMLEDLKKRGMSEFALNDVVKSSIEALWEQSYPEGPGLGNMRSKYSVFCSDILSRMCGAAPNADIRIKFSRDGFALASGDSYFLYLEPQVYKVVVGPLRLNPADIMGRALRGQVRDITGKTYKYGGTFRIDYEGQDPAESAEAYELTKKSFEAKEPPVGGFIKPAKRSK
jgi:hypothetical protein